MRFIAKRNSSDEDVTAIITCSDQTDFRTATQFFKRLKKAVTQWTTKNEEGKKAFENSCGDFNFGDLTANSEESGLINILASQGIFDFKIQIVSNNERDFNFD